MADYVSIISRAIASLADNSPESRKIIYDKARVTIDRKLRSIEPLPDEETIANQLEQLEAAINKVEGEQVLISPPQEQNAVDDIISPHDITNLAARSAEIHSVLPPEADDVILIDGIGVKTRENLESVGITRLSEIAALNDNELAGVTHAIGMAGTEIKQEWKAQALSVLSGELPRTKAGQERLQNIIETKQEQQNDAGLMDPANEQNTSPFDDPISDSDPNLTAQNEQTDQNEVPHFHQVDEVQPASSEIAENIAPAFENQIETAPVEELGSAYEQTPYTSQEEPSDYVSVNESIDGANMSGDMSPEYIDDLEYDHHEDEAFEAVIAKSSRRSKKGSSLGRSLGCLTIIGLLGVGGWYFRDEVKATSISAYDSAVKLLRNESKTQTAESDENSSNTQDQATPSKDASRLGSDGQSTVENDQPHITPKFVRTVDPDDLKKPDQQEQQADNSQQPAIQPVDEATNTQDQNNDQQVEETSPSQSDQQTIAIGPSGEPAYLYEEGSGTEGSTKFDASISWELAKESQKEGLAPEAVIKGVYDVPTSGLKLNITIKRNLDAALPASHIIELIFVVPQGFNGENIDQVSRFVMKSSEGARGESLVGVPARLDAGLFIIALNNLEQATRSNLGLLENGSWIDVPITYLIGRRGLVTLSKGESGRKVFSEALADWRNR